MLLTKEIVLPLSDGVGSPRPEPPPPTKDEVLTAGSTPMDPSAAAIVAADGEAGSSTGVGVEVVVGFLGDGATTGLRTVASTRRQVFHDS